MPLKSQVRIFFVLFFGVCFTGCGKISPGKLAVKTTSQPPSETEVISTVTLVGHTQSGRKKWMVKGDTADLATTTVELSPVQATSYGEREVVLTAKKGILNRESEDVHLEGDVVVTTSDGMKLESQTLDWHAKPETGVTPDWVTVSQLGMTIVGQGGVGYPKIRRVRMNRDVTLVMDGKEGVTIITSDGPMEVDYGRHKARFWKNVWVRDEKGTIRSDRLDVTLDSTTNQLKKATFWGHVRIHQEDKLAYANRAVYRQSKGQINLVGHTRLVMTPPPDESGPMGLVVPVPPLQVAQHSPSANEVGGGVIPTEGLTE